MAFEATERSELRSKLEEYGESGDKALRDEIVASQVGLAEYLARRFKNRGEPIEDLIQVALLGLLKAVERFDPSRAPRSPPSAPRPTAGGRSAASGTRGGRGPAPAGARDLPLR